jgi:hypothetical protein
MNEVISHIEYAVESDAELRSLFALLDDPDPRITEAVTDRIRMRGADAVRPLLSFMESDCDPLARERASVLAGQFNVDHLRAGFQSLAGIRGRHLSHRTVWQSTSQRGPLPLPAG